MLEPAGEKPGLEPASNLALEEALFLRNEGFILRVWENRESVIIGRAQLAAFETDVGYCRAQRDPHSEAVHSGRDGLQRARQHQLVALRGEVQASRGRVRYESSPHAIFRIASRLLLSALSASGVEAELDPPNRILTKEGKISGMAAYVSRKGFLCHGTLLVGADLQRVKALTTPSAREAREEVHEEPGREDRQPGVGRRFVYSHVRLALSPTRPRLTIENDDA